MPPTDAVRRSRRFTERHPRIVLAVKAACAAGIAWLLVLPLGGFAREYPYYAPLGASVAMTTTVVSSVRTTAQSVASILIGAGIALATRLVPLPDQPSTAVAIAVVIALGTIIAGLPWLGEMGGWVPMAGLFVLILGGQDPVGYVLAYGLLTGLGAVVGVVVNLVFPQLPVTPAAQAQSRLRKILAEQIRVVADGLRSEQVLGEDEWDRLCATVNPHLREADGLAHQAHEARRVNWRAGRWAATLARRERHARALQQLTTSMEEVTALVTDPLGQIHHDTEAAARLRAATADALHRIAELLELDEDTPWETEQATHELAAIAVRRLSRESAHLLSHSLTPLDHRDLASAAIATGLGRALDALQ